MIIFWGEGRLGNQLFQYAFIKNFIKRNERIYTCNFKDFLEVFSIQENISNCNSKFVQNILLIIGNRLFKFLAILRLVSSCYSLTDRVKNSNCENGSYVIKKGLFKILYIYPGYFQSEKYFNKSLKGDLKIKKEILDKGIKFINELDKSSKKIFIHLRRKDYLSHKVFGVIDATLPLNYYKKAISLVNKGNRNVLFIFLSDDPDYIKKHFKYLKNKVISENTMEIDFAIMTLCDGGIMSNSTFAWWGGYLGKENFLYAPKYWIGFKSEVEFPIGISPSFAHLVNFNFR